MKRVIYNGTVINEGERFLGYVVIENELISEVGRGEYAGDKSGGVDAKGGYIMAGVIDDQVHFRDPGLTHKGDIASESRAAAAGGVTSFMDMPNTAPQTVTIGAWEAKMERAAEVSMVNYGFLMGATNDNIAVVNRVDPKRVPGVKVFMGSSTGGMLVDDKRNLEAIFAECPVLVATHCEDEATIRANIEKFGEAASVEQHPLIRSAEACYRSSGLAVDIASKYGTRLHVLHLTTERELALFESRPLSEKKITNEVCVHHLWFTDKDYAHRGNYIKCNPAIKTVQDRDALREGLKSGRVDIVATDHAPHTISEKEQPYAKAPSGMPMVQHSLVAMLEIYSPEDTINYMAHRVAECFKVEKRGYLRQGYYADIVVVAPAKQEILRSGLYYKCGWSPLEGETLSHSVTHTFVNGREVFSNGELTQDAGCAKALTYNR